MKTVKSKRGFKATWYGVKTLFRIVAVGRPVTRDDAYDARVSLVEERVVLFKARSFSAAIRAAEREARRYARYRYVNPYGQSVVTRYLRACDAFELFDPPGAGTEVFSSTEVISRRVSDRTVVNRRFGSIVNERADRQRRRNILNCELSGRAPHKA